MRIFQGFRARLLAGIFMVLFVFIMAVSGVLLKVYSDQREEEAEKYLIERAQNMADKLDEVVARLDSVSSQLLASSTLQGMFVEAGAEEYQNKNYFEYQIEERKTAQDVLWTFNSPRRQIESINIFSDSSYVGLRYSPQVSRIQQISRQEKWQVPETEKYIVLGPHKDEWETLEEKTVISLVRPFIATTYRFQNVGIIEVQEKYSVIEEACALSEGEEGLRILVLDKDSVIYENGVFSSREVKDCIKRTQKNSEGELYQSDGEQGRQMEIYTRAQNAGWTIVLMQQKDIFNRPVRQAVLGIMLAALLISAAVFCILSVMLRYMTRPVLQLAEDMDQVKSVDQMPVLRDSSIREIQILQSKYRQLMERMKESKDELVLANETELKLRITGLQEQVNPHFLFNSLTAISAVSMEEGASKVPVMCWQLSDLFRYTSRNQSTVTLKDEMDYLETYLAFMKWRYEENFTYDIQEEGDLCSVMISRMIFQPLAENCFTHGFKKSLPPYRLRVRCLLNEDRWVFEAADNGIGFEDEVLDEIQRNLEKIDGILTSRKNYEELKTQNMAILNIYIRMKLKYGDGFTLELGKDTVLGGANVRISVERQTGDTCHAGEINRQEC